MTVLAFVVGTIVGFVCGVLAVVFLWLGLIMWRA
jgi:hypothetical protein